MKFFLIVIFYLLTTLDANDIEDLAKELNLYGGAKATIQWKRVFSSQRHLKRYNLDKIPKELRKKLERYLIEHSADSDKPIVPGL
ncbi:hypothetical protein [Sulfurimonas sp.]